MKKGLYKHFKGTIYRVIGIAKHSETLETVVVYRNETKEDEIWVRPINNFQQKITHNGVEMDRFTFIGE